MAITKKGRVFVRIAALSARIRQNSAPLNIQNALQGIADDVDIIDANCRVGGFVAVLVG